MLSSRECQAFITSFEISECCHFNTSLVRWPREALIKQQYGRRAKSLPWQLRSKKGPSQDYLTTLSSANVWLFQYNLHAVSLREMAATVTKVKYCRNFHQNEPHERGIRRRICDHERTQAMPLAQPDQNSLSGSSDAWLLVGLRGFKETALDCRPALIKKAVSHTRIPTGKESARQNFQAHRSAIHSPVHCQAKIMPLREHHL